MQITLTSEQPAYPNFVAHATIAMANLQAPEADASDRAPLEIVAVVDRSGSMSGAKMRSMKETLKFLVSCGLTSHDKLSIVTFDHTVSVALELTKMDAGGRKTAFETIDSLRVGGQTNLSGGLLKGIDTLQRSSVDASAATRAVLLFTDGIANHGITGADAMLDAARGVMQDRPLTIFTFGFGADHDEDVLKGLASATSGLYYYINSSEDIPQAFADCLGGLVSVVAQNVELVLEAPPGAGTRISLVHGTYATRLEDDGRRCTITLGDVYSEDEKAILVQLVLPALAEPAGAAPTLLSRCRYFDVAAKAMEEKQCELAISRPREVTAPAPVNLELDQQRTRVLVASAMEQAARAADGGDLARGRELLAQAAEQARAAPSASSELVQGLITDIDRVSSGYTDRQRWTSTGSKFAKMSAMSHAQQRSNHMSGASYEKSGKKKMKGSWAQASAAASDAQASAAAASPAAADASAAAAPACAAPALVSVAEQPEPESDTSGGSRRGVLGTMLKSKGKKKK